jgi:hypothetical protein
MSDKKITHLLIDTSYLFKFGPGLNHSDFMRLIHHSTTEGTLKIHIPHIVWEERRTQLLDEAYSSRRKLRESFEALKREMATNIVFDGISSPTLLGLWSESDLEAWSKEAMTRFATANKIEITSLAHDHAERAWNRYFSAQPPFNRDEDRKNRRKDIPDSWILEAAIDIVKKHPELLALVPDGKLSNALKSHGIRVVNEIQQVLDEIEKPLAVAVIAEAVTTEDTAAVTIQEQATVAIPENGLEVTLRKAREPLEDIDVKILGFVTYLGTPTKEQLFNLLSQSGVSIEIARNTAERLALTGFISDTGNHYLVKNKEIGELAAESVESQIIKLLQEN